MLHDPVLILNQNYQPLNICNTRRALVLISLGKAEIMLDGRGTIQSISREFEIPYVIRLYYMVKRPVISQRLSRRSVFYRDDFTCQYCGSKTSTLTLDHITPRSRGGTHAWENITSACTTCNHRKAGRTPREAGMELRCNPKSPRPNPYSIFNERKILVEWRQFFPRVK